MNSKKFNNFTREKLEEDHGDADQYLNDFLIHPEIKPPTWLNPERPIWNIYKEKPNNLASYANVNPISTYDNQLYDQNKLDAIEDESYSQPTYKIDKGKDMFVKPVKSMAVQKPYFTEIILPKSAEEIKDIKKSVNVGYISNGELEKQYVNKSIFYNKHPAVINVVSRYSPSRNLIAPKTKEFIKDRKMLSADTVAPYTYIPQRSTNETNYNLRDKNIQMTGEYGGIKTINGGDGIESFNGIKDIFNTMNEPSYTGSIKYNIVPTNMFINKKHLYNEKSNAPISGFMDLNGVRGDEYVNKDTTQSCIKTNTYLNDASTNIYPNIYMTDDKPIEEQITYYNNVSTPITYPVPAKYYTTDRSISNVVKLNEVTNKPKLENVLTNNPNTLHFIGSDKTSINENRISKGGVITDSMHRGSEHDIKNKSAINISPNKIKHYRITNYNDKSMSNKTIIRNDLDRNTLTIKKNKNNVFNMDTNKQNNRSEISFINTVKQIPRSLNNIVL